MKYVLQYIQPTCWDKRICKPVLGGKGWYAYLHGEYDCIADPFQATCYDDINQAHRNAFKHTSLDDGWKYRTLVEELPS